MRRASRRLGLAAPVAPPAGLEPAPPAPEAGALSAELRGRVVARGRARAGNDRTRRHHVGLPTRRITRRLPYPASPCPPITTWRPPRWSAVSSRARPRSTRRAICTSAASTSSTWSQEFGTPLFVYDEDHLRQACREAVAAWGEGVAYATKAFLCRAIARLAHEEGMHLDVASGGEMHVALAAGVPPERLVLHGNNKSDRGVGDGTRARGGAHRRRLLRRDRPARRPRRIKAARAGPARASWCG